MNSALFWRILIAVIVVIAIGAILLPLSRILGFPLSSDVLLVLRVCIAAIAVLYIVKG